jgi:hypothetical protein
LLDFPDSLITMITRAHDTGTHFPVASTPRRIKELLFTCGIERVPVVQGEMQAAHGAVKGDGKG